MNDPKDQNKQPVSDATIHSMGDSSHFAPRTSHLLFLFRPVNLFIVILTQYFIRHFIILPIYNPPEGLQNILEPTVSSLSHFQFFLLVLSTVCITAAGYVINDILDQEVDLHNKPHKQYIGKENGQISEKIAMRLYGALNLVGLGLSFFLAYTVGRHQLGYIHLICIVLLYFYSASWKKKPLIGNLLVASLSAMVVILVGLYETKLTQYILTSFKSGAFEFDMTISFIWGYILYYGLFAFLLTVIREIIKDLQDYKGDLQGGYKTLPIRFGISVAHIITSIFILLTFLFILRFQLSRLPLGFYGVIAIAFIGIQVPLIYMLYQLWFKKEMANYGQISLLLKIMMLLGLMYLPYVGMSISAFKQVG